MIPVSLQVSGPPVISHQDSWFAFSTANDQNTEGIQPSLGCTRGRLLAKRAVCQEHFYSHLAVEYCRDEKTNSSLALHLQEPSWDRGSWWLSNQRRAEEHEGMGEVLETLEMMGK